MNELQSSGKMYSLIHQIEFSLVDSPIQPSNNHSLVFIVIKNKNNGNESGLKKWLTLKNWFMLSMCISSYGCMQEVWKAQEKHKSCCTLSNSSFLSALQTSLVPP